jgi:CHAT domain-containing protein
LAHESEIVLIPGGRLAMLPLHAAGIGDTRFLDRWSVTYAPSLTAHLACRRRVEARAANPPRLLAITDPRGDLNASRNPASAFFPPAQTEAFAGNDARRSAVLAALPRCSHASFFTHARWDPDHPERSHIELAGDDRIEARDFAELDLSRSRMVALGACESGVPGVRVAPDEFQGMPVSLIEAGVPGVLATLWPVFNRAAERVLDRFFAAHIAEGLPPAVALRRAQRAVRNRAAQGDDGASTIVALGLRRPAAAAGKPARQAYDLSQPMFWAAFAYNGA